MKNFIFLFAFFLFLFGGINGVCQYTVGTSGYLTLTEAFNAGKGDACSSIEITVNQNLTGISTLTGLDPSVSLVLKSSSNYSHDHQITFSSFTFVSMESFRFMTSSIQKFIVFTSVTRFDFISCSFRGSAESAIDGVGGTININGGSFSENIGSSYCILLMDVTSATVNDATINNNQGGLRVYGSSGRLTVHKSYFNKNQNGGGGGAIRYDGYDGVYVSNSSFIENSAPFAAGGAIRVGSYGGLDLRYCYFESNSADAGGTVFNQGGGYIEYVTVNSSRTRYAGGGFFWQGDAEVHNSKFYDCKIDNNGWGGGLNINGFGSVYDSYFEGCSTKTNINDNNPEGGGGIFALGLQVYRSTFIGNTAESGPGGAIDVSRPGNGHYAIVDNCTFISNTAYRGGAVWSFTSLEITSSTFEKNTAISQGGAVSSAQGWNSEISTSTFKENSANEGGAIYHQDQEYYQPLVTIENCNFSKNGATNGGAIRSSFAYISTCSFTQNTASGDGGAIKNANPTNIQDCSFDSNVATNFGGAIFSSSEVSITRVSIINNRAQSGGGIYHNAISESDDLNTMNVNISSNVALNSGGGIEIDNGRLNALGSFDCTYNAATLGFGGCLRVFGGSVQLNGANIMFNSATGGGGIHFANSGGNIIGSRFNTNVARDTGGAIATVINYAGSPLVITDSIFSDHSATSGGTFYVSGDLYNVSLFNISVFVSSSLLSGGTLQSQGNNGTGGNLTIRDIEIFKSSSISGGVFHSTSLQSFEISGFKVGSASATRDGGAFYLQSNTNVKISDSEIKGVVALSGAAILMDGIGGAKVEIFNSNITDCTAEVQGGGVHVRGELDSIYFQDCLISNNSAPIVGGAFLFSASSNVKEMRMNRVKLEGNNAILYGGSIAILGKISNFSVENTLVHNSTSSLGGVIYAVPSQQLSLCLFILSSNFTYNYVESRGSVLYIQSAKSLHILDSNFEFNFAGIAGGVIHLQSSFGNIEMERTRMISNESPQGGALNMEKSFICPNITLSHMELIQNLASSSGGGALNAQGNFNLSILSSSINENRSPQGGALFLSTNSIDSSLSISSTVFNLNTASDASGGAICLSGTLSSISISDSIITKNYAKISGGSVFLSVNMKNLSVESTTLDSNSAGLQGGGMYISGSISNSEFENVGLVSNSASFSGGAIYSSFIGNYLGFFNGRVESNRADGGDGGGFFSSGSITEIRMKSSRIEANYASNLGGGLCWSTNSNISTFSLDSIQSMRNSASSGAFLSIDNQIDSIELKNSTVENHSSSSVFTLESSASINSIEISTSSFSNNRNIRGKGGVFSFAQGTVRDLSLKSCHFDQNSAVSDGGSLYLESIESKLSISSTAFRSNKASGRGGVLFINSENPIQISECEFSLNSATDGGALFQQSNSTSRKRISVENQKILISDSNFYNNSATVSGGSISLSSGTNLTGSQFSGNSVGNQGNSIAMRSGVLVLESNSFSPSDAIFLSDSSSVYLVNSTDSSLLQCVQGKRPNLLEGGEVSCRNFTETVVSSSGQASLENIAKDSPVLTLPAIIAIAVGGTVVLLIVVVLIIVLIRLSRARERARKAHMFNSFDLIDFSKINLGQAKKSVLNFDDFHNLQLIGSGAFGVVSKAHWRELNVAVKQIKSEDVNEEQLNDFLQEVAIIQNLRSHPNVVLFLGITFPPQPLSLITEYCEGGNLYTHLREKKVTDEQKNLFILGISKGMLHLHLEKVVHRDLAVRNILLTKHLEPKVSDFGLSREQNGNYAATTKSNIGPIKWMAPEAITGRQYSFKSDIFSFGVVIWEILTVQEPYGELNPVEVAIAVSTQQLRLKIPTDSHPMLAKLMEACWEQDPSDRPGFSEICSAMERVCNGDEGKEMTSYELVFGENDKNLYSSLQLQVDPEANKHISNYSGLEYLEEDEKPTK